MEYRLLGRSDLKVSRVGFGTMSLDVAQPHADAILHRALDSGINYFDTADMYQQGMNEFLLGRAFRNNRESIVLATKVGNQWRPDGSGWDWNPSKKYILTAIEESLKRLQTDYIDLYQLHGGTMEDPIDEIIETFESLKTSGKIRHYGISSIRPNVIREYVQRSSITCVMMQYSLLDRRPEEEMLSYLHHHRIAVIARGAISKGLLVSKPADSFLNYNASQVEKAAMMIKAVSGKQHTPFQTAAKFVLQHPAIDAAVIGIRTEDQLKDALHVFESPDLGSSQMDDLRNVLPANKYMDYR
jgi:aryl-alcohol dehydrogenase-like predicted oxidoreductase